MSEKKVPFYAAVALSIMIVSSYGCASQNVRMGSLKLGGSDYKKLIERQMVRNNAKTAPPDKLPKMTGLDHEKLGDTYFRQGNHEMAFVQYEKALRLHPSNARIQYKKGLLFLTKGANREAIREFQKVLKKEPDYALALEGIGHALFEMGQFEHARKQFLQALRVDPKLWRSHIFLGIIHDYQKRPMAAVYEYQAAIRLKPDQEGILYNNLGVSYSLAGRYEEAVASFKKALRTRSSDPKIYNNLGMTLSKIGRYQEALEAFRRGGGEAQAYNNLGCIYLRQGEYEKAVRFFEKAMVLAPAFYTQASENLRKAKMASFYESSFSPNTQTDIPPSSGKTEISAGDE